MSKYSILDQTIVDNKFQHHKNELSKVQVINVNQVLINLIVEAHINLKQLFKLKKSYCEKVDKID